MAADVPQAELPEPAGDVFFHLASIPLGREDSCNALARMSKSPDPAGTAQSRLIAARVRPGSGTIPKVLVMTAPSWAGSVAPRFRGTP